MSFKGQELAKAGRPFDDDRVALDETIYFALDTKRIIKLVRSVTIDRKVQVAPPTGGMSGGPNASGGGPSIAGSAGAGAAPPGAGGSADKQYRNMQKRGGGPATAGGGSGMGAPQGVSGQGRSGGGGASGSRTQYVRFNYQQIFLLEQ
jgi:hypothetical protein